MNNIIYSVQSSTHYIFLSIRNFRDVMSNSERGLYEKNNNSISDYFALGM